MKPRKVLVTLTMRTDVPMIVLNSKDVWQHLIEQSYERTDYTVSTECWVEKVDAIRIKESK